MLSSRTVTDAWNLTHRGRILVYLSRVKYAVNTETNEAVAIKILDKDKIQTRNMGAQIKKEISIMKMINHHHVVSVKDVFATSAKIFIVLEFVGGGELFDKIANEGKLPEEKARFYFKQLVEGLSHCHNNGVCHRDLKPEVSNCSPSLLALSVPHFSYALLRV